MRFTGFIGPSYKLNSVNVDCQRCVNLYPEIDELGTGKEKEVASLAATPGLSLYATLGGGPIRGTYTASDGKLYVVSGNQLYKVTAANTSVALGTLLTSAGQVSIADNGIQLVVVDGINGYYVTLLTAAFAQITDPAFLGADQVVYQGSRFVFNKPNTGSFYAANANSVTFDASQIATAEGNPDYLNGMVADHLDLWLFGTQSAEVWFNSGAAGFPYERVSGAYIEIGCAAKFSVAKMSNTVYWLSKDDKGQGMVFSAKGYQPQRISTNAVESAIQSYGDISDAVAYTYQENGHYFYCLNFTAANTTWVFDSATNLWHERAYLNQGILGRHLANCHAFAFNKHIVGDYQTGNLYQLSSSVYSDNGAPIVRKRVSPHLSDGLKRLFHAKFQLDIESGVGLDGLGQGIDPQVMLQFSDDGGHSWSNEKWVSVGKIGQTKWRPIWRRLGTSRDRVYSVSISDPVPVRFIGAELDTTEGES